MDKKYKLPKEFAEKWVSALRSGDYKQGTKSLLSIINNECSWCCIGVAGSVLGANNDSMQNASCRYVRSYLHELPDAFILSDDWKYSLTGVLTRMNDIEGKTFPEIADWIEQNCEFI